jgi:hypothetical protein
MFLSWGFGRFYKEFCFPFLSKKRYAFMSLQDSNWLIADGSNGVAFSSSFVLWWFFISLQPLSVLRPVQIVSPASIRLNLQSALSNTTCTHLTQRTKLNSDMSWLAQTENQSTGGQQLDRRMTRSGINSKIACSTSCLAAAAAVFSNTSSSLHISCPRFNVAYAADEASNWAISHPASRVQAH